MARANLYRRRASGKRKVAPALRAESRFAPAVRVANPTDTIGVCKGESNIQIARREYARAVETNGMAEWSAANGRKRTKSEIPYLYTQVGV